MKKLNFKIPVTIFKEGDMFVAYTPALDLSTSGKTFVQVRERFSEAIAIFFEEIEKLGVSKASAFWSFFGCGKKDYTKLRKELFQQETVDSVYKKIKGLEK